MILKKIVIIVSVIIAIFIALAVITNIQQKQKSEGNPFGKSKIHPATQEQLDDPLYQNIILPEELEKKLDNGESATIYFYKSDCPACKMTSPVVVPMAQEMEINLEMYNLLEFKQGWDYYNIHSTPTLIHFEDGKEVSRLENYHQDESVFSNWLQEVKETTGE